MKYSVNDFKGMLPILANSKLPDNFATTAINTKLTSGDVEGYFDIGNPFQLTKAAPIVALEKADNGKWFQFSASEQSAGAYEIRCVPGIIPGDTTGRRYITGYNALSGVPQFTNTFFGTDPSQQGVHAAGAYPYNTFALGVPDPTVAPTATAPGVSGTTYPYDFAAQTSVNNATVYNSLAGTGYVVGDIVQLNGGTLATGFTAATGAANIQVSQVSSTGAITGLSLYNSGFYQTNLGPGQATVSGSYTLPVSSITLSTTSGIPTSGTFQVVSTAGTQTLTYTGVSGSVLTGVSGGTGTVSSGTAVQMPVTVTGGTGSGLVLLPQNVLPQHIGSSSSAAGTFAGGWNCPGYDNGAGSYIYWTIGPNGIGIQEWGVAFGQGDLACAYSTGAFSLKTAQTIQYQADLIAQNNGSGEYPDTIMWFTAALTGKAANGTTPILAGPGIIISQADQTLTLYSTFTGTNGNAVSGSVVAQVPFTNSGNTYYRINVQLTQQTASALPGYSAMITVATQASPGTILATVTGFVPYSGELFGVGANHRYAHNDGNDARFSNILIQVSQPASEVTVESTNYVYTEGQQIPGDTLIQQSGPSNPSVTIDVDTTGATNPPTRATATIVIPPAAAGEYIVYRYLYRLVATTSGAEDYTLVTTFAVMNMTSVTGTFVKGETVTGGTSGATGLVWTYGSGVLVLYNVSGVLQQGEVLTGGTSGAHGTYSSSAASTTTITYLDSAQDSALPNVLLPSATWLPPPATMQGIVAGPNNVMGGFVGNVVCFSAPGYPYAWPLENQYAVDTNVTSLTPTGTSWLITTQSFPYSIWGTDPTAYSMAKEVSIQGCVATRGVATHKQYGVLFPSGNGYCYYKGSGLLDLVTVYDGRVPFDYEQWQALVPSSIIAVLHDRYLYWWVNTGTAKYGYIMDLSERGFGLIQTDVHVTCAYVDKATDTLYLVPDFSTYAINGSAVTTAQNIVSQWEAAATYRTRTWFRKNILYPRPVGFQKARVQNNGSGTVALQAASEQGTAFNNTVSQQRSFTIASQPGNVWQVTLTCTGANAVRTLTLGESGEQFAT